MLPGIVIGYALNSGGGSTGYLIIADWHDVENYVAAEVRVKSFKSKDVGIRKMQDAFIFLCADVSREQEGHAQRRFDAGGVPSTLGQGRVDFFLQCARWDSLQPERAFADDSEADRDAMEAKEDFWRMSGDLQIVTTFCSEKCMYRKSDARSRRQTNTNQE